MKLLQIRFIRKLSGAILGAFIATLILTAPGFIRGDVSISHLMNAFELLWLVPTFFMFVVGIPVSYVSDWMTNSFSGWLRGIVSAEIHIGGAILFILMWDTGGTMSDKIMLGVLYSACYWLIDELLRLSTITEKRIEFINNQKKWSIVPLVPVVIFIAFLNLVPKETNLLFLIPEDYSGEFYVAGSIPREKPLKKEGDWYLVEIGKDGSARTCMELSGGSVDHYIVTKSGERKKARSDSELLDQKPQPGVKYVQGGGTMWTEDYYPRIDNAFY